MHFVFFDNIIPWATRKMKPLGTQHGLPRSPEKCYIPSNFVRATIMLLYFQTDAKIEKNILQSNFFS